MNYSIFQINFSKEEQQDLCSSNPSNTIKEKYDAFNKSLLNADHKPGMAGNFYDKVAVIKNASTLDDVFKVGNGIPVNNVELEKLKQMHSVSVGDIIVDDTGIASVILPIGFKEIHV